MSETAIVLKLAAEIRKTMKRGPRAMRRPGLSHSRMAKTSINGQVQFERTSPGAGHNSFTPDDAYALLIAEDEKLPIMWTGPSLRSAWPLANRLFKRAMKNGRAFWPTKADAMRVGIKCYTKLLEEERKK